MAYLINYAKKTILLSLSILSIGILSISCSNSKKSGTANENSSSNLDIPPLFDRKGELAKAVEWDKTKTKIAELNKKLEKNSSDIKERCPAAV